MPRRKQTRRRRQWTPRPSVWPHEPPDELDELLGALDVEDELDELEMLFGDGPEPARPAPRPVRSRRGDFIESPLARAWADRVGDCGAGVARLARGLDYLVSGSVLDLQVSEARLAAVVQGSRRYRVVVDIILPAKADRLAALERVQHVRASAPPGIDPRLAVEQAIVAGPRHLFPSPAQLGPECTCPDGAPCKHVIATVLGFGVLLSREPELLFSLWGVAPDEIRATPPFVIPPLAADRLPLADPLAVVFGIDLLDLAIPCAPSPDAAAPTPGSPAPTEAHDATPTAPVTTPPSEQSEVGRDYLRVLGIQARTIDAWLRTGVLRPTGRKDIYERTPEANRKIASFLAR